MTSPSVYNHFRPIDANYREGTYRVVGTTEETVTLLRVANANGRRTNTGEIVAVSYDEFDGFDAAENPEGNRPLGIAIAPTLEMGYWSIRVFIQQLAAHPISAAIAVVLVLVGSFGEQILPLPDIVLGGLIIVGSLGLAYVGSGRL